MPTSDLQEDTKKDKEPAPSNKDERLLLVLGSICLSVIGVIAFLITGQLGVVVAMNAPLIAIIGRDIGRDFLLK